MAPCSSSSLSSPAIAAAILPALRPALFSVSEPAVLTHAKQKSGIKKQSRIKKEKSRIKKRCRCPFQATVVISTIEGNFDKIFQGRVVFSAECTKNAPRQ